MWTERKPIEGETIKIEFASWTNLGTRIGVFLRTFDGKDIIDLGRHKIYLDSSTYLVKN